MLEIRLEDNEDQLCHSIEVKIIVHCFCLLAVKCIYFLSMVMYVHSFHHLHQPLLIWEGWARYDYITVTL